MSQQPLPLTGIKVVDYSHFLAGPFMSRCLSAMGAEVIKVERPTAGDAGRAHAYFKDGQSGYFLQQNMGKQGLCVNVKDKRGLTPLNYALGEAGGFGFDGKSGVTREETAKAIRELGGIAGKAVVAAPERRPNGAQDEDPNNN